MILFSMEKSIQDGPVGHPQGVPPDPPQHLQKALSHPQESAAETAVSADGTANGSGPKMGVVKRQTKTHDVNGRPLNTCQFISPLRMRQCGLQCKRGQQYCFAHLALLTTEPKTPKEAKLREKALAINTTAHGPVAAVAASPKERVPCPLDPTHSVWKHKLKGHVTKCNSLKQAQEVARKSAQCGWFSENYNVDDVVDNDVDGNDGGEIDNNVWRTLLEDWTAAHDSLFGEPLPFEEIEYKEGLSQRFQEVSNQKHIRQQSSLIGQLEARGLMPQKGCCVVEFGCGRGEFSRYLNRALTATGPSTQVEDPEASEAGVNKPTFLLVDRDNPRVKFDNKIQAEDGIAKRLKVDIKDLKLAGALQELDCYAYVGISKHLCGVATDLTLRCILRANSDPSVSFKGFLVAMCCRHCCTYDWLLPESKTYLQTNFGVSRDNFKYLRKTFAWATNGVGPNYTKDDVGDHFTGLTFAQREVVGLKMRRILDESRRHALSSLGLNARLVRYCDPAWSLENTCLVVTPSL